MRAAFVLLPWMVFSAFQERQENPEYKAWSAFPAGAWVRHRHLEETADGSTEREITQRLIDRTPARAVLDVEAVRIDHGIRRGLRRERLEIPARIGVERCPDRVEDREVQEGEEEVIVDGKRLKCRWLRIVEWTRSGKNISKVWSCREIPGEIVNMESRREQDGVVRTRTTLLDWRRESSEP